jgi:hypothetical protein
LSVCLGPCELENNGTDIKASTQSNFCYVDCKYFNQLETVKGSKYYLQEDREGHINLSGVNQFGEFIIMSKRG